jgi:uncharacterized membrane protein
MPVTTAHTKGKGSLRVPAIDWMRGLVMILMTIDHASDAFNRRHLMTDAVFMYRPGTALPIDLFMTRWITHLCAPTFVFLAGAALSMSVERQLAQGVPARAIDRFIVTRGLILIALEPLWMSWMFAPGMILLQVLFAIGASLICMALLRRLPSRVMLGASLLLFVSTEAIGRAVLAVTGHPTLAGAVVVTAGVFRPIIAGYPILPWLAIMMFGWWFGRWVPRQAPQRVERGLLACGLASLLLFLLVRGANGYGNMGLLREDGSLVQWLHVSKYPPSLTYTTLELGLMALLLAGFFRVHRHAGAIAPGWTRPLLVFGQTAFFFYLLHAHLLKLAAWSLGVLQAGGLRETYLAWACVLVVLYPLCVLYGRYKRAHPTGWTRYL